MKAREAEIAVMKREPLGPLHGVPLSLKDALYTRGLRTTGGSRLFADLVPEEDNVAVGRLKAAGAVILGKTNLSEFGFKALTDNPSFGMTRNPWDRTRTSSSRHRPGCDRRSSRGARSDRRGTRCTASCRTGSCSRR